MSELQSVVSIGSIAAAAIAGLAAVAGVLLARRTGSADALALESTDRASAEARDVFAKVSARIERLVGEYQAESRALAQQQSLQMLDAMKAAMQHTQERQLRSVMELVRLQESKSAQFALEQANQDVTLAEVYEQLARLTGGDSQLLATKRLAEAKERLAAIRRGTSGAPGATK